MIKENVKRSIFRWVHVVCGIPIIGYIYSNVNEAQQYGDAVRMGFVPVLLFSGFWMYAGLYYALISVGSWIAATQLSGFGAAVLTQVVLLIGRKIYFAFRNRTSTAKPIS